MSKSTFDSYGHIENNCQINARNPILPIFGMFLFAIFFVTTCVTNGHVNIDMAWFIVSKHFHQH